jgi:abortive infection bacteriophage resistance protein
MCINLEHSLKISLLHDFETNPYCDGYAIVDDFLTKYPYLMKNIATISNAPFTTDLVNKYFQLKRNDDGKTNKITNVDCPIWVFLELITFGDLLTFLTYYYRRTNTKQRISCNILKLTKSLRNGCAHNNCILANLQRGSSSEPPEISREIAKIRTISKEQRNKKLSCRPMLEFTALLYAHSKIVSGQVKKSDTKELLELFLERMLRHKDFFQGNELIISNYQFACK